MISNKVKVPYLPCPPVQKVWKFYWGLSAQCASKYEEGDVGFQLFSEDLMCRIRSSREIKSNCRSRPFEVSFELNIYYLIYAKLFADFVAALSLNV